MPTELDQRRLNDVEKALALPEPSETHEELLVRRSVLYSAIAAAQSTDDLGSQEANDAAMANERRLWVLYRDVEAKLKALDESK